MPQHLPKPRRAPRSRVIFQRHANVDNTIDSVVGSTDYAADAVNADKAVAGGYRDSGGRPPAALLLPSYGPLTLTKPGSIPIL